MFVGNETDHDVRCAACGSFLYSIVRDGEYVHVNYGVLAEEPEAVGPYFRWLESSMV